MDTKTLNPPPTDDARWFAEEVHPHETALRNWLRAKFPSFTDTDDLVQETYARLMRARTAGVICDPKPYLYATARNIALDFFRHERSVTMERFPEFDRLPVFDDRSDPAETASRNEEYSLLEEAVQMLPDRCRKVFMLRKVSGYSQKEIAVNLGITENTVAAQAANGMRRCIAFFREREFGHGAAGSAVQDSG